MINIIKKENCIGCWGCKDICPTDCIIMNEDYEGFVYPQIELGTCNDCGLCEKVCPVINQSSIVEKRPEAYAIKNKNEGVRKVSSSGGVFTLLAEQTIENGGVVFGARFNSEWSVVHDYTETVEGLSSFRGSKYVQSLIGDTYKDVENFLKAGREVLFTGTPCQVSGLNLFLRKQYDNLLTVDFICHGVPSPKVFRMFLSEYIDKQKADSTNITKNESNVGFSNICNIQFRDKADGWEKFSFVTDIYNTEQRRISRRETLDKNIFMRGFLRDLYLRPSCHACPAKSGKSGSDLTMADFWGIDNYYPEFNDNRGVSLVLINNSSGDSRFKGILKSIYYFQVSFEEAVEMNPSWFKSVLPHPNRDVFFKCLDDGYISALILKYSKFSLKKRIYIRFVKALVTMKVDNFIKKVIKCVNRIKKRK